MPLLDTDILIDVFRNYSPAIAWLKSLGSDPVVIPGYVAMELIQGCQNKAEQQRVERLLQTCQIVWPSEQVCSAALAVFAAQHLSSAIGILDVLIGQTSIALNMPLHTFNQKHYKVISSLTTVAPYPKSP